MKDPLQLQPTPYEILDLGPGCTPADINKAFGAALAKRGNVQKLTMAKRTLERPQERALVDLFLYDEQALAQLRPNPLLDPDALQPARRAATAEAWESQCRQKFPDLAIIHSLAVFWYWWADSESERLAGGGQQETSGPAWDKRWEAAIGYWVMVTTHPDFWRKQQTMPADIQKDVQSAVIQRLAADLHRYKQYHRDHGNATFGDRLQALEIGLADEQKTAKALLAANIMANRRPVSCGRLLLAHLKFQDKVRGLIDTAFAAKPHDKALQDLREDLSPYGHIAALIASHRLDAAVEAIGKLSYAERATPEVKALEFRAWSERGKQQASLERIDDALASWGMALDCTDSSEGKQKLREEIENTCMNTTASMQDRQRDDAIRLLEKGLKIVKQSEKLSLRLADLLTDRGIESINDAQKQAEKSGGPNTTINAAIDRGIADLDRATQLGSKRAAENAQAARDVKAQLSGGGFWQAAKLERQMTEVAPLLKEAMEAAERENWDRAIEKYRLVIQKLGTDTPDQLKKNLATALNNRAMERANTAVQKISSGTRPDSCLDLLNSAHADLREATKYDPSSDRIKGNLRDLEDLIAKVSQPGVVFERQYASSSKHTRNFEEPKALQVARSFAVILIAIFASSFIFSLFDDKANGSELIWLDNVHNASIIWAISVWIGKIISIPICLLFGLIGILSFFGGNLWISIILLFISLIFLRDYAMISAFWGACIAFVSPFYLMYKEKDLGIIRITGGLKILEFFLWGWLALFIISITLTSHNSEVSAQNSVTPTTNSSTSEANKEDRTYCILHATECAKRPTPQINVESNSGKSQTTMPMIAKAAASSNPRHGLSV